MQSELDQLRSRAAELASRLEDEESLELNAEILDHDPGDPVATNRLGIGLLKRSRFEEALAVLDAGLRVHPDDAIMQARREEAVRRLNAPPPRRTAATRTTGSSHATPLTAWTDFEPEELVDRGLAGPGRDACIRLCAASIRASERIDAQRTAVTPIKTGRRFRVIGGIFTGVAPWGSTLSVAVPLARRSLIQRAVVSGAQALEPAKAVPCVELAIPRGEVPALYDDLLAAHVEHLRLSLDAGPPTHFNRHHPGLRQYLLDRADAL